MLTAPGQAAATASDLVVLLDVDNTLLDNDRFGADLDARLAHDFGVDGCKDYRAIYDERRERLGYADYLGALQAFRAGREDHPAMIGMSRFLLDYPFADLLYPAALDVIAGLRRVGTPVILSDGDIVFQPRKVRASGLWDAVDGRVLVYLHKDRMRDDILRRHPARHYAMVDDKPHLLAAMKSQLGDRVTTVFVRQGHYAHAAPATLAASADITIDRIGELSDIDIRLLLAAGAAGVGHAAPAHATEEHAAEQHAARDHAPPQVPSARACPEPACTPAPPHRTEKEFP